MLSDYMFTVIIPVFNGEKKLPLTLNSLQRQTHESYEIIVVDDASTDNTVEVASEGGAKIIRLGLNMGPATARNKGAKLAKGHYLLFTDSDVLLPKSALTIIESCFKKTHADAVQGTFSDVCPHSNFFSQYKNLYNRFVLNQLPDWIDTTFTSITAVKKEAFINCGGFDENIPTASVEDRTLGQRLRKLNYKIYLDRTLEVVHDKKLTFWGFVRNQYRRSRDLIKLLLRNTFNKEEGELLEEPAPIDEKGRFGTNSLNTMLRIPIAYSFLLLCLLGMADPIFYSLAAVFFLLYLYLIASFEFYLFRLRSLTFALKAIPVNVLDALISGLGIGMGILAFFLLRKKY